MYNKMLESIVTNHRFYRILGFTIVRQVIEKEEIHDLRSEVHNIFIDKKLTGSDMPVKIFLMSSKLTKIIFNKKIVNILKEIFGEPYVMLGYPQCVRNNFGSWHVDSGSEAMAPYLFSKKYGFAKCGIFLQSNNSKHGGSIRIRWFSHLLVYNRLPLPIRYIFQKLYSWLNFLLNHTVKLNAGDFIVFDSRLEHASEIPDGVKISDLEYGYLPQPHEHSKYVIYWDSCNVWSEKDFSINIMKRALMEYLSPNVNGFFPYLDSLSRSFPADFPADFVNDVNINNICIPTLKGEKLIKIKNLYTYVLKNNDSHKEFICNEK